ncbi:MAG TPA: glycosyltransferase family 2 protein, partial [Ilumatobacteraceae bacterium]|nr:glycosyltransferase family 2 protein [Ilumatobacteraceae bacterium]
VIQPTVTVVIPTYREAAHIEQTLSAVRGQTYAKIVEVLVVDGGSDDGTQALAAAAGATVLDNPHRAQAAGLNVGIAAAAGEVIVRVDGHCTIEPDYVERCVDALARTGAAMVGGAMSPVAERGMPAAIALAMASPLGAGPARFHSGGAPGWVDTVYLGAYRTADAVAVGGYATDVGVNEDAEFAVRLGQRGGVWFEPSIRSTYRPRQTLPAVAKQFWRYGTSRAATVRRHPSSLSPRQLAAPVLVLGLCSPWRRRVLGAYLAVVAAEAVRQAASAGRDGLLVAPVLPAMHVPWGIGFLVGLTGLVDRR